MATYHFVMKRSTKTGTSAGAHYDYIARENRYALGEKSEELAYKSNGNMPEWAKDNPADFWRAADAHEGVNRVTYREIELALPNELSRVQQN